MITARTNPGSNSSISYCAAKSPSCERPGARKMGVSNSVSEAPHQARRAGTRCTGAAKSDQRLLDIR
jgi:hypothetical protein